MTIFRGDDPELIAMIERSRNRENRGRRAGVYVKYSSTGQGVVEFENRINFGLTYVEEPWVTYGAKIDMDSVRDQLSLDGDDLPTWLPQSTGYVTEWDSDERGFYTGAWVAVTVYYPPAIPVDALIDIEHYFTFEAIAIKDIPLD